MSCILFDGKALAKQKEERLIARIRTLHTQGKHFRVVTATFGEDAGSAIYTKLKKSIADRVGISYEPHEVSLHDDIGLVMQSLRELSVDRSITGIMIQKPSKSVWMEEMRADERAFTRWWDELVSCIDPQKDVDVLTPVRLGQLYAVKDSLKLPLVPATVRAVASVLSAARETLAVPQDVWRQKRILVIGKSAIVGQPLTHLLRISGHSVVNVGRKELSELDTQSFPIIVSASGSPNSVTADKVARGSVVIDVGSPVSDVAQDQVSKVAAFLTPVPGGVGPMTVVSLMENIVDITAA